MKEEKRRIRQGVLNAINSSVWFSDDEKTMFIRITDEAPSILLHKLLNAFKRFNNITSAYLKAAIKKDANLLVEYKTMVKTFTLNSKEMISEENNSSADEELQKQLNNL